MAAPLIRRHILCFGNPMHGDDGFGPAVFARLAGRPCPPGLRLVDAGTPGLSALALFEECDEVIVVDALAPAGAPGRIECLDAAAITTETTLAPHGMGVGYMLRALAALPGGKPAITIIGAQAQSCRAFQPGLSPAMARAVPETVARLAAYFEDEHERLFSPG